MSDIHDLTTQLNELCASFVGKNRRAYFTQPECSREERIRRLRIRAHNILFQQISGPHFVRGLCKVKRRSNVSLSEIDKINWHIYKLRCSHRYDEANQLDKLLGSLKNKDGKYDDATRRILRFLVCLTPADCTTESKYAGEDTWDVMPTSTRKTGEDDIYASGPPVYGDSRQRNYTGIHYMHYPSRIFQTKPLSTDSHVYSDKNIITAQMFSMEPGSELHGRGWFAPRVPNAEYERGVRSSLFGALVESRIPAADSMSTRLRIPSLSETRPRDIQIPKPHEVLEDEGFSGSLSRSTSPACPTTHPASTLWEEGNEYQWQHDKWFLALKAPPKTHHVWEQLGRKDHCVTERPCLTEAGLQAVDELYKLDLQLLQMINPDFHAPSLRCVTARHLVRDVINLLTGVPSDTFTFNEEKQLFLMDRGTYVSGRTPEALQSLCAPFLECGTHCYRIERFSTPPILDSMYHAGLVFQAFTSAVRKYLQYYRAYLLAIPRDKTLMQINFMLNKAMRQMRYLAALCMCDIQGESSQPKTFPTGVALLTYLYQETVDAASSPNYPLLLSLLRSSCTPYLMFIQDWVFDGVCKDVYDEFMIQVNVDFLRFRDKHYWTHGFVVMVADVKEAVPLFIRDFAENIFVCGKAINLLRLISPRHFLFGVEHAVPRVMITFNEEELHAMEKRCELYTARMNQLARQHTMTREKLVLLEEQKKKDLLARARVQSQKERDKYIARTQALRKAGDEKKRKEFQQLKENMEQDLQRRAGKEKKEKDEDAARMKKLTRQELLEQQIESDLEAQVRQEVVDYYRTLMDEATEKEQRALWRVRRMQLQDKRQAFFLQRDETLQAELETKPLPAEGVPHVPVTSASSSPSGGGTSAAVPRWVETRFETSPREKQQAEIPKWAQKGLDKSGGMPFAIDESEELPDGNTGQVPSTSPGTKQAAHHASDETTENQIKSTIKISQEKNVSVESSLTNENKPTVRSVGHQHISVESSQAKASTSSRVKFTDKHVGDESEPAVEDRRHLRTVENRHANIESLREVDNIIVQRLKKIDGRHAGLESEGTDWKIRMRNEFGHVSETTLSSSELPDMPRLKRHKSLNAFTESLQELRTYQVKRHRKVVAGQSVDKESDTTDAPPRAHVRVESGRSHASEESQFVDEDFIRLQKFKLRNKRGHASDSTVQKLLYDHGAASNVSTDEAFIEEEMKFANDIILEPYKDKFEAIEKPPDPHLLANLVVDSYSGFSDVTSRSADVNAHRFIPLTALLKKSVSAPLLAQVGLVNRCVVDWFLGELKIGRLFGELRSFLFMQDGEFGQSVSDQLFEKLATNPRPAQMLNPVFLNGVLSKALQYSSTGSDSKHSGFTTCLSFALKHIPHILQPNAVNALDCLELVYRVDWPLNIVITDTCVTKYGGIFTFMLQLKRVVWTLKDVWHRLKRDAALFDGGNSVQFRQLQLFRQEMQHFVKVMQEYVANQIIHVTWREFQHDLQHRVENLDDLHRCHAEYLNKCILRCLLNKKAKPVMKVITDIFGLILKFRSQLVSRCWTRKEAVHAPGQNGDGPHFGDPRHQQGSRRTAADRTGAGDVTIVHPGFRDMCDTFTSFQEYSLFLFRVVRKLMLRGYQPHLQELILRLDFNEHYSKNL